MNRTQSISAYLIKGSNSHISELRLTSLVYLADWFSSLVDDKRLTDLEWQYNHKIESKNLLTQLREFNGYNLIEKNELNNYGLKRRTFVYIGEINSLKLSTRDQKILDIVNSKTKNLDYNELTDYVLSTSPLNESERFVNLDLLKSANLYKVKTGTVSPLNAFRY